MFVLTVRLLIEVDFDWRHSSAMMLSAVRSYFVAPPFASFLVHVLGAFALGLGYESSKGLFVMQKFQMSECRVQRAPSTEHKMKSLLTSE